MSVPACLAASAIVMLLPLSVAAQTAKTDLDLAEAAYVTALRSVNALTRERDAAKTQADKLRRDDEEKRADILTRQKAASGDLEQRLTDRSQALEAQGKRPPVVEAKTRHEQELASARSLLSEREAAAKASREDVVQAQSQISFLKIEIERTQSRIAATGKEIDQEKARLERLNNGDPAELDDLARRAFQEREDVTAILQEFTPAFLAATTTARIAIGMHMPTLYKAKQSIERIKTNFCGMYTVKAREHISLATEGITQFLRDDEVTARISLATAERMKPRDSDATCDAGLADVGREEADHRIAKAQARITTDEIALQNTRQALSLAQTVVAKGSDAIAEADRPVQEARKRVAALEALGESMKATWEADLRQQQAAFDARKRALEEAEAAAKAEFDAARAPFTAELAALGSLALDDLERRITDLSERADQVANDTAPLKETFVAALAKDDIQRQLKIDFSIKKDHFERNEICVEFSNKGKLPIGEVYFSVIYNKKETPPIIKNSLNFISSGSWYSEKRTIALEKYSDRIFNFLTKNRYSEDVPYLMPGAVSEPSCAILDSLLKGDSLRALEAAGQGQVSLSQIGIVIDGAVVADPTKETRSRGVVAYELVDLKERYRDRLQHAVAKANDSVATGRAQAASATAPVAASEPTTAPPAVLDRDQAIKVQKALIAAGHLTGKADGALGGKSIEAVKRWQSAQGLAATGQLTAPQVETLIGR